MEKNLPKGILGKGKEIVFGFGAKVKNNVKTLAEKGQEFFDSETGRRSICVMVGGTLLTIMFLVGPTGS